MKIADFALERWYGRHEHNTRHNLSASDCETLTVAELLELAAWDPAELLDMRLGYTESNGDPALRSRIADLYPGLSADHIMTTAAPQEGIFLAMHALLQPSDRVVVMTPCYQSLHEIAASIGCSVVDWELRQADDRWRLDLDRLESLLPGAALLVINAPHNPTGYQPSADEWDAIAGLALKHGVRIFSDEMYRGLERKAGGELPPLAGRAPGAVSLWGLSKSFGLPGLRVGWLATDDASLLARVGALKDYTTICSSGPSERLALAALSVKEALFQRARDRIGQNLRLMRAFAARNAPSVGWMEPAAGPIGLLRIHGDPASSLSERARTAASVLVAPSRLFGLPDDMVRIGLGRADFAEGLTAFERCLGR